MCGFVDFVDVTKLLKHIVAAPLGGWLWLVWSLFFLVADSSRFSK